MRVSSLSDGRCGNFPRCRASVCSCGSSEGSLQAVRSERWQQVERLYHASLERGAEGRAAFLVEACAGDEGLRREVESLLAYEDQAEHFSESPALEVSAKIMADKHGAKVMAGQTIYHYRVTAPLGACG